MTSAYRSASLETRNPHSSVSKLSANLSLIARMAFSDVLLLVLLSYFLLMNATVERFYCHEDGSFKQGDTRFLVKETVDFSIKYNPLFLSRPEWIVKVRL